MGRFARVAMSGVLAGGLAMAATTPAEAHVGPGGAVIAGLAGLGIGAAIASDHPHRYDGGYGYAPPPAPVAYGYARPAYGYAPPADGYGYAPPAYGYAPPPPPPAYGYEEVRRCRVTGRWDGWQGRYVPVRRCW